jgi:hypothetical protein
MYCNPGWSFGVSIGYTTLYLESYTRYKKINN